MLILVLSLFVLLIIGVPIGYSLGLSSFVYFSVLHPELLSILPQRLYSGMNSYAMIALPLFTLMGLLMNSGGITSKLIEVSLIFVGKLRGGLGLVNVFSSMIFGGISGSSVSDTASIGAILIPEMEKKGYTKEFATGITVASSTMGMIIPPSIPMVLYAVVSGESVGKLFLGGLIPGVLIGVFMMGITLFLSWKNDYPTAELDLTFKEKAFKIKDSSLALIMPLIVIGSVTLGVATPTESAGIGVLYAFIVGFFIYKAFKLKSLPELFRSSITTSANVMIIIAFSSLYIWILSLERAPEVVANFLLGLDLPNFAILLLLSVVILMIGTFIDVAPAILLLTPVFQPALATLGISSIQFGVLLITALAIGLVTPPVGMCLNVGSTISKLDIIEIFKASLPFLMANLLTLLLVALIPGVCTWLPNLLMK